MAETSKVVIHENDQQIIEDHFGRHTKNVFDQNSNNATSITIHPRPDPINDDPADFIDVVATDSPTKLTEKNVIRVISAAPPSLINSLEDDDERKILEGLRKSRETPKIVRRIFVRRDPNTGSFLVDKNNTSDQFPDNKDSSYIVKSPLKLNTSFSDLPIVTDEECDRAAEATKEFTLKLKSLKLTPKQKDAILLHAGSLVDKLITITKESKDREIQQKMEDDRVWLRNEIDSIIEKRLGSIQVGTNRQFWRNEAEKFTEMALTNLMVYRENGTRKQDVLTSALAGFNMRYIQTHKHGLEIISTIKKLRSKFVESPRACRAFVDVCADFLMNNCFEKYFPCNAEKYALLRHCEQIFDIKLDHKFFTLENGTGKLDRRIRTIRTTDYKKGGHIQRKRKPLRRSIDSGSVNGDQNDDQLAAKDEKKMTPQKLRSGQKRVIPGKRTWTRQSAALESPSTSKIGTRSMAAKRIHLAPVYDKKLIVLTKKAAVPTTFAKKPNQNASETRAPLIDEMNEVELPK